MKKKVLVHIGNIGDPVVDCEKCVSCGPECDPPRSGEITHCRSFVRRNGISPESAEAKQTSDIFFRRA